MYIRSPKVQLLFWLAFFSVMFFLLFLAVGVQYFLLEKNPPQSAIYLEFILFGFLIVLNLAGTFVSIMIDNKFYYRFFGTFTIAMFLTLLFSKSYFD